MANSTARQERVFQGKRALDLIGAGLGLIVFAPVMAFIAVLIKLDSPGPAIFRASRVTRNGRAFTMYKFRSMCANAEELLPALAPLNEGGLYLIRIKDDPRVTRVGAFLRQTGLDELPQLVNVLRGEMSLVGPRPQAPNEVALYDDHQRRRLAMPAGITGLWQITARDDHRFDTLVALDLAYISHWSLRLDLAILFMTAWFAVRQAGVLVWGRLRRRRYPMTVG